MANGHGGYRQPSNPAPVSGPGALSRRTDGGPGQPVRVAPGGEYGSRKEMEGLQSSAPMAEAPTPASPAPADLIPFGAPTQNPGEPVTAGAAAGPGVGPQAAGIQDENQISLEQVRPLLRSLELIANLPGSTPETRTFVRNLKAKLSG